MKKHILGFAVFSFIFASFAIAYAFIYAPAIPHENSVEVFGVPVYKSEPPSSCHKKKPKKLTYEVINSHLDFKKNKLYTTVNVEWNGSEPTPKIIYVNTEILLPSEKLVEYDSVNIATPFDLTNRTQVLIETDVTDNFNLLEKDNIYAKYSFSDKFVEAEVDQNYSEIFPVVVSHENNSQIVRKGQLIVR
ncbi:MAG TPA: hypothetical protein PKY59_21380 [Pyrinomonadaceae bacterium]|nr:hypothetical protein [Pyrinomonadaceae bacterium]